MQAKDPEPTYTWPIPLPVLEIALSYLDIAHLASFASLKKLDLSLLELQKSCKAIVDGTAHEDFEDLNRTFLEKRIKEQVTSKECKQVFKDYFTPKPDLEVSLTNLIMAEECNEADTTIDFYLRNYFEEDEQDRFIFHFCRLNPTRAQSYFSSRIHMRQSLCKLSSDNTILFLKLLSEFKIKPGEKQFEYHQRISRSSISVPWSDLLAALFSVDGAELSSLASTIIGYHPEEIKNLMNMLQHKNFPPLIVMNDKSTNDHSYRTNFRAKKIIDDGSPLPASEADLMMTQFHLLSNIGQCQTSFYSFSKAEKELVRNKQIEEIQELSTRKEVLDYYESHKDSLAWNEMRLSIQKTDCKNPAPTTRKILIATLESRLIQITYKPIPIEESQRVLLESQKEKVIAALVNRKGALESKSLSGALFSSAQQKKIQAIDNKLQRLATINHPSELAIFSENLLYDGTLLEKDLADKDNTLTLHV
jgi:hypothetical protein